jgi:LuxR family maltose regulon positive regulatory protein
MSQKSRTRRTGSGPAASKPVTGAPPLIGTKIQVPRRRPDLLSRPRLVNFLHAHLDRKLILISAPAGYGKTSLLTDFAHDTDLPVCWYTLDPFDYDLRVFLEYLIGALARRFPTFGQRSRTLLQSVSDLEHSLHPLVATLVQEVYDAIPEYFVLVLDDHHSVEGQEQINEFLDLFVTYMDENCHVILASRTLPALPNLSLLVARGQATGLSIDELRFTPNEIQALAKQNYQIELEPEQASHMAERTGGWITGLLLTAARRWQQTQHDEKQIPSGRINIGLYDYLTRQVMAQQPPPLHDFLLDSSVLEELDAGMCAEVLGVDRPDALLEQIRARNLFVVEFEGDDNRLRYHDLFREFLQATLRRRNPERFRALTYRAAEAYARRGEWGRAVGRYLEMGDHDQVAQIVEQTAKHMYSHGRGQTLATWIDALPPQVLAGHLHFLVQRAKIHADQGEHTAALELYNRAESAFAAEGNKAWQAYALANKGSLLRFQAHCSEAVACCQEALGLVQGVTEREKLAMAIACRNVGLCQVSVMGGKEGQRSLQQALQLYEGLGEVYDVAMAHHDLGLSHEVAGDLDTAAYHYREALQRWQQLDNLGPWAHTLNNLGVVHYLRGEYEQAAPLLHEALAKAQQGGVLRVEAAIWASLGDLYGDLGAYEQARQAYTEGLAVATRAGEGFIITYTLNAQGQIAGLQGDMLQAQEYLQKAREHATRHHSTYELGLCHTSLGILAAAQAATTTEKRVEALAVARTHLDEAVDRFEAGGFCRELARASFHRGYVAFLGGAQQEALADLEKALGIVDQLGFDQFLVVDGQQVRSFLQYAAEQGVRADILPRLLARIAAHQTQLSQRPEPVIHAEPSQTLRIVAFGLPTVELDGVLVQWPTLQSRDLLFCLLQHPQGLSKEEIGALFWPDHDPHKLHNIFRSTLYRLRRVLFRDSVTYDHDDDLYRFNWDSDYWFDAEVFESLLGQANQAGDGRTKIQLLEEALSLYQDDYLKGIFADWSALERERLRELNLTALDSLARLYINWGQLSKAIELYQRLLIQDPYQETAHRELMRCFQRQGNRAAAVQQYQDCVEILQDELGLHPMPETENLYLRIIS